MLTKRRTSMSSAFRINYEYRTYKENGLITTNRVCEGRIRNGNVVSILRIKKQFQSDLFWEEHEMCLVGLVVANVTAEQKVAGSITESRKVISGYIRSRILCPVDGNTLAPYYMGLKI